jgi:hypothetical protein
MIKEAILNVSQFAMRPTMLSVDLGLVAAVANRDISPSSYPLRPDFQNNY